MHDNAGMKNEKKEKKNSGDDMDKLRLSMHNDPHSIESFHWHCMQTSDMCLTTRKRMNLSCTYNNGM